MILCGLSELCWKLTTGIQMTEDGEVRVPPCDMWCRCRRDRRARTPCSLLEMQRRVGRWVFPFARESCVAILRRRPAGACVGLVILVRRGALCVVSCPSRRCDHERGHCAETVVVVLAGDRGCEGMEMWRRDNVGEEGGRERSCVAAVRLVLSCLVLLRATIIA